MRQYLQLFSIFTILSLAIATITANSLELAPNWRQTAKQYLYGFEDLINTRPIVPINDKYLEEASVESARRIRQQAQESVPPKKFTDAEIEEGIFRCVKKKNYWCMKNRSKWPGSIGEDKEGHAVFEHPKFSAQAKVSLMRRYYTRCKFTTLEQIINSYAPAAGCNENGYQSDAEGKCIRNDPGAYALFLEKRMNIKAFDNAELFDGSGKATARLRQLMKFGPIFETGFFLPTDELIDQGIALEASNWQLLLDSSEKNFKIPGCPVD